MDLMSSEEDQGVEEGFETQICDKLFEILDAKTEALKSTREKGETLRRTTCPFSGRSMPSSCPLH